MIPVLTPEQSNTWDQRAAAAGVELATLMESAGRAAAVVLAHRYAYFEWDVALAQRIQGLHQRGDGRVETQRGQIFSHFPDRFVERAPRPIFGLMTSRPEPRIIKMARELGTEVRGLQLQRLRKGRGGC